MPTTYVQFSREEFEEWLTSTGMKWKLKPGTAGMYLIPLSDTVAVEVSSSLTGRDDAVSYAQASMSLRLMSLATGLTLNRKAQEQNHFKRTKGWRDNLKKGLDRMVAAYRASASFYDAISVIKDREAYKRENIAKIESISNWQSSPFLSDMHKRLVENGVLTKKQLDAVNEATARSSQPAPVNTELLGHVRALWAIAKQHGDQATMAFAQEAGELIKNRRDGTPAQKERLNRLLDQHETAIRRILDQKPDLKKLSAERVATAHHFQQRWALFRSDPAEYRRLYGKYAPPGVYC